MHLEAWGLISRESEKLLTIWRSQKSQLVEELDQQLKDLFGLQILIVYFKELHGKIPLYMVYLTELNIMRVIMLHMMLKVTLKEAQFILNMRQELIK